MRLRKVGGLMIGLFVISATVCASSGTAHAPGTIPARPIRTRPVVGTKWNLNEVEGRRVPQNGLQPYFVLKALNRSEHGSSGKMEDAADDCGNQLTGMYRVSDDRLSIRISSSTLKACLISNNMPPNENFPPILGGESRFRVQGEVLEFIDGRGAVKARFIADHPE